MRQLLKRALHWLLRFSLFRYTLAAGWGFGLSYTIFFAATTYYPEWYWVAAPAAGYATYVVGFWVHKLFSFQEKRKYAAAWQWPVDALFSLGWNATFLNPLLLVLLVEGRGDDARFAQLLIAPYFFLQNFLVRRYVIFGPWVEAKVRGRRTAP